MKGGRERERGREGEREVDRQRQRESDRGTQTETQRQRAMWLGVCCGPGSNGCCECPSAIHSVVSLMSYFVVSTSVFRVCGFFLKINSGN